MSEFAGLYRLNKDVHKFDFYGGLYSGLELADIFDAISRRYLRE